jgi:hypothetical protein
VLREAWFVGQCPCGEWIGFPLAVEVYKIGEPVFIGVCPVCGSAYSVDIFAVHAFDPQTDP